MLKEMVIWSKVAQAFALWRTYSGTLL
ncbi:hypothetical protein BN1007_100181 [Klebsiella variicola]|nr:hypothetical protein BN1007_100181 [Klebsiella variicola]